jgi:hypothetical protein
LGSEGSGSIRTDGVDGAAAAVVVVDGLTKALPGSATEERFEVLPPRRRKALKRRMYLKRSSLAGEGSVAGGDDIRIGCICHEHMWIYRYRYIDKFRGIGGRGCVLRDEKLTRDNGNDKRGRVDMLRQVGWQVFIETSDGEISKSLSGRGG